MQISINANRCEPSPMRKFHPYAVKAKKAGKKIYHLNIGQPDLPTPKAYYEAIRSFDEKTLEYAESPGKPLLIDAIRNYYHGLGVDLDENEVLITTGGSEALLLTCLSILDPYTEVIIPEPYYPNYTTFVHAAGGVIRALPTNPWEGYRYAKRERMESLITKNTRAILITNPGNPTGVVLDQEEMRMIADIAKEHNLFLICDEVYREFCYDDKFGVPTMARFRDIDENLVIVDSVSKRYSECGIRVGMVVTRNKEILEGIMHFCQSRLSPPLLGQIAAEASIEGTELYSEECFNEYKARRDFFIEGLNKIPGVYSPFPEGAFYTVASLPVKNAEDFCRWCLTDFCWKENGEEPEENGGIRFGGLIPGPEKKEPEFIGETVMMAPAAGFYANKELGANQVRMAYVLKREDLARALKVLEKALEAYRKVEAGE